MEWIVPGWLMVQLLGLGALVWAGGRRLKKPSAPAAVAAWPAVSVVAPIKGLPPDAGAGLRSILAQDYPDAEFLLVTEDENDPSVPLVRDCLAGARGRHVVAGRASACGQKNFSLLAGVRASDPGRPVLVFCDAGHTAPPDWLQKLVAPLAAGETGIATGYHFVYPRPPSVPVAGRAITVLLLHLLQQIPGLTQPWGGAIAMTRALFEKLKLDEFWSRQVVDDVSLAVLLNRNGIPARPAPEALSRTVLEAESWAEWSDWLTRQLFYLKLYFPVSWCFGGLLGYGMAVFLLICPFSAIGAMPWALLLLLIAAMRTFHPSPGPLGRWMAGGVAAVFMACACHLRTLFMRRLVWRGIVYEIGRDGTVRVTEP